MSTDISLELVNVLPYTREQSTGAADGSDTEEKRGVLEKSAIAWYARGSVLEVFNINSRFKVISHNFHPFASKSKPCTVTCVEEVDADGCKLLAVGLRLGVEQSQVVFLTVRGGREVGRIDVQEDVKLLRYVDPNSCSNGLLSKYQGCIAIGTADGKAILVDTCFKHLKTAFGFEIAMNDPGKRQCHIEFSQGELKTLLQNQEKVEERGLYFGLQLSHKEKSSVEYILDIVPLKVLCIGFADGTVLLWDLVDHSIMHRISPPTHDCSVVALNYVEPSDDPKACLYLWIFYAHPEGAFAFLHMIMCEEKYCQQGTFVYDQFLSCSSRLNLTSYDPGSVPLNVQTVTKKVSQEDEPITLSVLSWLGSNGTTTVLVFDLNQWYKAEMPYECDWQQELTHTVVFHLKEGSYHAQLNERSLVLFRSIQRPEEHFYPSSLGFEIQNFNGINCSTYRWIGLQNKLLEYLEQDGANAVIQPAALYGMLCRAALLPQFFEPISPSDGISCIELWADGSHLGAEPQQGVSLSTITDWIWNRSKVLKSVCNRMLASLMADQAGRRIDVRTQDALSHCTRQMKQLAELYQTIMKDCLEFIPENIQERLSKESATISAAADYQNILQWLLHVGILPEANYSEEEEPHDGSTLVPYPYAQLGEFYSKRRHLLDNEKSRAVPDLSTSGKLLFIDNYLEREFDLQTVWNAWHEDSPVNSRSLYPPSSLQKALRILLIPETPLERKLVLLLYLFMDVVAAVEDERFIQIALQLEKFPRVFNVSIGLVERVRAFWQLDHGNVTETVSEFLSPLSSSIDFPQWHRELTVSVLLRLDAPNLALKVLRAPGAPVSPQLELTTLVQNNLIPEAFNLQRRTPQPEGRQFVWFIEAIMMAGKPHTLLEFALNDEEKYVLRSYLRDCPVDASDSLMLGHLLQNCEFVEAVQLVDRLGRRRNVEVQKEILGLYHNALDPMSQQLAYLTYQHGNELEPKLGPGTDPDDPTAPKALETLSSSLIRNRADFRVRVLHHSITAIKEAAVRTGLHHERPFLEKPSLGVFQCRPTVRSLNVCYPVRLDPSMNKRRQRDWEASEEDLAKGRNQPTPLLNEEDGYGNPRKKRYLGPERTVSERTTKRKFANLDVPLPVIPEFRPMKPKFNFTTASSGLGSSGIDRAARSDKSTSHSPSIFLTTPPFAKKLEAKQQHHQRSENHFDGVDSEVGHDDSFTPPSILKSTQSVHDRNSSPIAHDRMATEAEEKVLRFDLPPGSTTLDESCLVDDGQQANDVVTDVAPADVATTPVVRRDLDLSGISNDDFYSPEVTMEQSSLQQVLSAGGLVGRPSIHRSRSGTPSGSLGATEGVGNSASNIAIIIEDHIEEDCSSKVDENEQHVQEQQEYHERQEDQDQDVAMEVDDENVPSKENVFVIDDSDAEQGNDKQVEEMQQQSEVDEIVILDEESSNPRELQITYENQCTNTFSQEQEEANESGADEVYKEETEQDAYDEADDEEVFEESSYEEEDDNDDEDNDDDDDNDDEDDDDEEEVSDVIGGKQDENSVLEVIDLSDEEEPGEANPEDDDQAEEFVFSSSASSSSSSSDDGDGAMPPPSAAVTGNVAVEQDVVAPDVADEARVSSERWDYMHLDEANIYEDIICVDHYVEEATVASTSPDDIQVPTTSSSTHRTEAGEGVATSESHADGEAESSEVEDLSVAQGNDDAEEGNVVAARDLSVAGGDQWPDSVASSSSGVVPSSNASTPAVGASAPTATAATSPPTSPSSATGEKVFGRPKNAHELEVPAMNLSVKPDEAHGSSRKNSKGEENGLTEDARALNLSAGQQELAEQQEEQDVDADDGNVSSNQEEEQQHDQKDNVDEQDSEATSRQASSGQAAQSSNETKTQTMQSDEMEVDLRVSDDETSTEQQLPKQAEQAETVDLVPGDDETTKSEEQVINENQPTTPVSVEEDSSRKTASKRTLELRRDNQEASTSTPRANVKTRLMAALEKSATAVDQTYTPSRRRSTRASSVAPETTNTPISPLLSRSRRFTSVDNLVGTPDTPQPLTPRRSTRGTSLVKELFTGGATPQKRTRRTSLASNDTENPESLANSPNDSMVEPPEPSERSFASSTASSTRRSLRVRKSVKPVPTTSDSSTAGPSDVPALADYSSNRRLTRHQLAVMEKSMESIASASTRRISVDRRSTRSKDTVQEAADAGDSEPESIVSNVSNQSSLRSTRSRASRTTTTRSKRGSSAKRIDADEERHADSDSDQSLVHGSSQRSARGLEPIAEEGESNPSITTRKRRGRMPKK
uniref:ELYS-like domain-containing protein n=1 Tax=Anopheles epiroticus TaxID=199890 RepID=A0A182PKT2_9DIPT